MKKNQTHFHKTLYLSLIHISEPTRRTPISYAVFCLKKKIENILKCKYEIIEKQAGIRPATKDRRPFVGFHPNNNKIGIINGLGSKGISLAPYCTKVLIDNIQNHKNINREINIKRYISLY